MNQAEYEVEKGNVAYAKRLGMIDAQQAFRRLLAIETKRAKTAFEEAREIKINREG